MTSQGERDPTPGQLKYIARLTWDLGMREPSVRSFGEAGLLIRELETERAHRRRVKSDKLARACYNALATHGIAVHYTILTAMVQRDHPELKTTERRVLTCMSWNTKLFMKKDTGVYFLASKSEGRTYPEI